MAARETVVEPLPPPLISQEELLEIGKGMEVCLVKVPKSLDINKVFNIDISNSFSCESVPYTTTVQEDKRLLVGVTVGSDKKAKPFLTQAKKIYFVSEEFPELPDCKLSNQTRYKVPKLPNLTQRNLFKICYLLSNFMLVLVTGKPPKPV
ncbi:uncharacterized protein LOC111701158 [Eurytemora carolleeae]|uniref:uncharacterized protein LOC111701158 n=1 Tax=Eurytemora carolleeae TaxID=1294199 RepID=UPI000C78DEC0|nr:uncharacterized protein LOC111701158 [Eurytemora carolleeae]|eukprot:XP_023328093.1 uncharacterized protein LOC111701158 [Eurytemora affinis]